MSLCPSQGLDFPFQCLDPLEELLDDPVTGIRGGRKRGLGDLGVDSNRCTPDCHGTE